MKKNNSYQAGIPLGDLQVRPNVVQNRHGTHGVPHCTKSPDEKANPLSPVTPGDILFVRNRMLYARAALNAKGTVRFGLRHIREFLSAASLVRF